MVFDLGGVLIDWNPRYLFKKIFADANEMEWFLTHVCHQEWNEKQDAGRPFQVAIDELIKLYPKYESQISAYHHRWEEMVKGPIEKNVRILESLNKNKTPLYSITNWSEEKFNVARHQFPFLNYFKDIVISGVEKIKKPDPKIFETLLKRNDLQSTSCIFIDDVAKNCVAASALGFSAIHCDENCSLDKEIKKYIS